MLASFAEGARFRRRAIRALREQGLTFGEWRVLRATHRLVEETRDAVSQQAVAERVEMDSGSVSVAIAELSLRGLIDIGFDESGWSQRLLVTNTGKEALEKLEARVALLGEPWPRG